MRKKLDTRFPASRIKKIMQTDEEVGKIALAVPLLVSKALELFLQHLCDRTYAVTLKRGAKTMSSSHLKQCVHNFSVFDFLKETVSRVPDVGFPNVGNEDRSCKRRKSADDEDIVTVGEPNRSKREMALPSRVRGRGRGKAHKRVSYETKWDVSHHFNCDGIPKTHRRHHDKPEKYEDELSKTKPKEIGATGARLPIRDFDLNIDLDENGFAMATHISSSPAAVSALTVCEMKYGEHDAWLPLSYIDRLRVVEMDRRIEEEDYDDEED